MTAFEEAYPERDGNDILGGYPDFSMGEVTAFFAQLTEEDRAAVQHYLEEGMEPRDVHSYIHDLLTGYVLRDPARKSERARELADHELHRLGRYVHCFVEASNGFPTGVVNNRPVTDSETGEMHVVEEPGWAWEYSGENVFKPGRASLQESARDVTLPYIEWARVALADPGVTQEALDTRHREVISSTTSRFQDLTRELGFNDPVIRALAQVSESGDAS